MDAPLTSGDVQEIKSRWSDDKYDSNHDVAKRDVLRLVDKVEHLEQACRPSVVVGGEEG